MDQDNNTKALLGASKGDCDPALTRVDAVRENSVALLPEWAQVASEARLDAYRCTVRGVPYPAIVDTILSHVEPSAVYCRKDPHHETPKLALIKRQDENCIGIKWDASRSDAYLDLQGPDAPRLIAICQDLNERYRPRDPWPQVFRTTRIDGALDLDERGTFDRAVAHALKTHAETYGHLPLNRRPKISHRGNWDPANAHDLGTGRTLYIGSRDTTLLRIYEKGKQLRDEKGVASASPHHVRIEVESHPQDLAAYEAHTWHPLGIIGTSRTAIAVVGELLGHFPTFTKSRDHGTRSNTVRKLLALRSAYAALFWELAHRYDSTETAARMVATALSASHLDPAICQTILERGVSAPELLVLAPLSASPEA